MCPLTPPTALEDPKPAPGCLDGPHIAETRPFWRVCGRPERRKINSVRFYTLSFQALFHGPAHCGKIQQLKSGVGRVPIRQRLKLRLNRER